MTLLKPILLSAVAAVAMAGPTSSAHAFLDFGMVPHYEAYDDVHVDNMTQEQNRDLHEYLDYEHREQCQSYQEIPEGFARVGCRLVYKGAKKEQPQATPVAMTTPKAVEAQTVLRRYEVNFAFDSAALQSKAFKTLEQVADEITQHNPSEVIVAGHTDTAGASDYNYKLSQKRAMAVSEALTKRGVENRVLDQEAFGESRPAIQTADGVSMLENRRVVIEFRK